MRPITHLLDDLSRPIIRLSTTRANSRAGLVADAAISLFLLQAGFRRNGVGPAAMLLAVLTGLVLFTFVEYGFHRWLFHGPTNLLEQGHRKHHEQPLGHDSLPFFVSPLLMAAFALLLANIVPATIALLVSGALAAGYACYGAGHLVIHQRRFRHPLARRWAAAHHIHHRHADRNFGVTTPLWDILLGTRHNRMPPSR